MIDPKKKSRLKYLMIVAKGTLLLLATTSLIYPQVFMWLMRICIFTMIIVIVFGKELRNLKNKKNATNKPT